MVQSLSKILPPHLLRPILGRLNYERLYEIRLRANRPVSLNYGSKFYFLTERGLASMSDNAFTADAGLINEVVVRATEYSLYAVNDQLRQGFITVTGGVRIGIAGETVREAGETKTVKNYGSVNIRIPHEIKGCADKAYQHCCAPEIHNTLIVSPPGAGKTTILRDLARLLGNRLPAVNVLLADERNELAAAHRGIPQLEVGMHTDVIANALKPYAFTAGIRSLAPDVLITDELATLQDAEAVEYAAASGVRVIASCHAQNHLDLSRKPGFDALIAKRVFSRYINLSQRLGAGTLDGIFDADFNEIGTRQ
ncbi:MAG: AAA family ATPase [Firmicutes bacterium]|nr:AAA family ATPase [Bacillota bacterium]